MKFKTILLILIVLLIATSTIGAQEIDAVTGSPEENATLDVMFTPELIDVLLEWLHTHIEMS